MSSHGAKPSTCNAAGCAALLLLSLKHELPAFLLYLHLQIFRRYSFNNPQALLFIISFSPVQIQSRLGMFSKGGDLSAQLPDKSIRGCLAKSS